MDEIALMVDLHKDSKRQGPGSERETLRALQMMDLPKGEPLKIADIGCGSGDQTTTLAQHLNAHLTAVDLFSPFLDQLRDQAIEQGVNHKIEPLQASMEDLPFASHSLDVIWSEGAIYNMGFEKGIKEWKTYLKKGGYLAVSEITWITNQRPQAIADFWTQAYPEIATAARKIQQLEEHGYALAGYFYLDQSSWLDNYYGPLEASFEPFLERHHHSAGAVAVVEESRKEIALYQAYKDYYSYGFYVAQKQ